MHNYIFNHIVCVCNVSAHGSCVFSSSEMHRCFLTAAVLILQVRRQFLTAATNTWGVWGMFSARHLN